jgi:hypothetical protein
VESQETESTFWRRPAAIGIGITIVFCAVVAIMWQLMPYPRRQVDYLVMGATGTMVSLAVLFIVLIRTSIKRSDIFFKRRKQ